MTSDLSGLAAVGSRLADAAVDLAPDLVPRARRFAERLETGRFHVSILGEFKRGKSTLINALVGGEVLPMGVVPVTAIQTEVHGGQFGARVDFLDGTRMPIGLDELREYVTETANPENKREVERVEVSVPAPLLTSGLVLVDTPGIGSIHRHNTDAAHAALLDTDGAILVLAADAPLSDAERELLRSLTGREARVFVVVNKADHLDGPDLEEVRRFVRQGVEHELGRDAQVWCVAARPVLEAIRSGEAPGRSAGEFTAFANALADFVEHELVGERLMSAQRELVAMGRELEEAVVLRDAMLALDDHTLTQRIESFKASAREQQAAAENDHVMLEHSTDVLAGEIGARLADFARKAPRAHEQDLLDAAFRVPRGQVDEELRDLVERWVQEDFEAFRQGEAERAAAAWRNLATACRARTEERVNAIRAAAADLFEIRLPAIQIPEVTEERDDFFYLFLHVGSVNEDIERVARRLLPQQVARRRAHRRAHRLLFQSFDKHAGRARWDLTQRVERTAKRFEQLMNDELALTVQHILTAAEKAKEAQRSTAARRAEESFRTQHALTVARRAQQLTSTGGLSEVVRSSESTPSTSGAP